MEQHDNGSSMKDTRGGKILFLIDEMTSIKSGGTERQLVQMVQIARACGWTPQVCVLRGSAWFSDEEAGCPVNRLGWETLVSVASFSHGARLARWLRQQQFDVMQTIFPESNLVGPWLAKLAGIPTVIGTRRNLSPDVSSRLNAPILLQRVTNLLTAAILVNSEAVLRRTRSIEGTPFRKLFVIHNGIDLKLMSPSPERRQRMRLELGLKENDLLIGNLSGLRPIKGIDIFVDAARLVHQTCPEIRFVVVGEGSLKEEVEALVERVGLKGICTVAGSVLDVRPYLAAIDIAVLCSKAEGFSNSLLEYMAAGLAIVATDVGGNREALGGSGLLIPPSDAPALARAIMLLQNSDRRQALGTAARQAVERFDLPVAEAKTADIYSLLFYRRSAGRKSAGRRSAERKSAERRPFELVESGMLPALEGNVPPSARDNLADFTSSSSQQSIECKESR